MPLCFHHPQLPPPISPCPSPVHQAPSDPRVAPSHRGGRIHSWLPMLRSHAPGNKALTPTSPIHCSSRPLPPSCGSLLVQALHAGCDGVHGRNVGSSASRCASPRWRGWPWHWTPPARPGAVEGRSCALGAALRHCGVTCRWCSRTPTLLTRADVAQIVATLAPGARPRAAARAPPRCWPRWACALDLDKYPHEFWAASASALRSPAP